MCTFCMHVHACVVMYMYIIITRCVVYFECVVYMHACRCLLEQMDMSGKPIDTALRELQQLFRMPVSLYNNNYTYAVMQLNTWTVYLVINNLGTIF